MNLHTLTLLITVILFFGCSPKEESANGETPHQIRINQLGYYPGSIKVFVAVDGGAGGFSIIDSGGNEVFTGELAPSGTWEESGEQAFVGDFSELSTPGEYQVVIGDATSHSFEIKERLYADALRAAVKSYYFQRASMAIDQEYGGDYSRAAGHPDTACYYHASTGKEGQLSSSGGWYDAGDYGKYIVNAALSVGQMLNLLELIDHGVGDDLDIPESGNGTDDLADELRYELDWMLTMQDDDGGVFHKLTALNFSGFIMPEAYDLDRYIIGKGTAATLDFAAVMAQASRIFEETDPEWAGKALQASKMAFEWAKANPDVPYSNPSDVSTGEYGDNSFGDDFYWAATELSLTTGEDYPEIGLNIQPVTHELANSWKAFVRNVAFHSSLIHSDNLENAYLKLADSLVSVIDEHPYRIALNRYEWGSNSDILNQAMILCMAHAISGNQDYLDHAVMVTDYIFGKNATGYSFLTGFGDKQVMHIHHRPSEADGVADPVPGFIAGGPNVYQQDAAQVTYASDLPASSFEDVVESYASNEVCLNWNAPAVFVLGYLEAEIE